MRAPNIILLFMLLSAVAVQGENLLKNSSFEEGDASPKKWLRSHIAPEQAVYSQDTARSGKRGVGILATDHKYGGCWIYEDIIKVKPGEKYSLGAWIKSDSWGGNHVSIAWFTVKDGRPLWVSTSRSKFVNGKKDWMKVELVATVPEKISFAKVQIGRKWKADGPVFFDDISLKKLSISNETINAEEKLNIQWSKALPVEQIDLSQQRAEETVSIDQWEKNLPNAGSFKRDKDFLEVSNTALKGVGWVSSTIKVNPDAIYEFKADVKLKKAYHVALGVALYDASGKLLEIRKGASLRGTKEEQADLLFRTTAEAETARFLVTQSRSSGSSQFSKMTLTKFVER